MRRIVYTLLFLALPFAVSAETRYVSDHLLITLRTGQGTEYQVIKSLPSGTRLELLKENGDYSQVRTEDGVEGWVRNQYIIDTPIAKDQLATARQKIDKLQVTRKQLQQQIKELKSDKAAVEKERDTLANDLAKVKKELDGLQKVAAQPIQIARENGQLKKQLDALQQETARLTGENKHLANSSQRNWFLTGAGVLGGGLLLGLLLPLLRPRKRTGMFD
jgi:SH3 domain protein